MKSKRNGKKYIWLILFILFLLVLAVGVICLLAGNKQKKDAASNYEEMKEEVNDIIKEEIEPEPEPEPEEEPEEVDILTQLGIEIPGKNLDWNALHEENQDIYAWIYVPDTTVDYPVLQHPTDNSYYLNYNIDGTKGYPGCIYTEDYNTKTFSDIHTVLYGHNLKDKTMFSTLHNFEDEELFYKDHYIFIYTEDYVFVYQIFAAYEFGSIHLLANYDLTNEYVYEDYLKSIFSANGRVANIRQDIEVGTEDKIVTLSTCTSDHNASLRFLVTGVLLNPQE